MSRASLRGAGCQVVRPARARLNGHDLLCGQPARFIWLGLDPRHLNKTVAEQKKYIRNSLLMCVDCAKECLHDFAWHIKDGKARLERLDIVKQRTHCNSCGNTYWVAWDGDVPQPAPGSPFLFCVRCGQRTMYAVDADQDAWDVMSEDLAQQGVLFPVQLLKMLYDEWPRSDRRFYRFYDYVRFQMELFEKTGELEVVG